MSDPKRSVSFALSQRQFLMLEELIAKSDQKRSEWLQQQIQMAYMKSGTAKQIKLHTVEAKGRKWFINEFNEPCIDQELEGSFCNPNVVCVTCSPIWETANQRRKEMMKGGKWV